MASGAECARAQILATNRTQYMAFGPSAREPDLWADGAPKAIDNLRVKLLRSGGAHDSEAAKRSQGERLNFKLCLQAREQIAERREQISLGI